MSAREKLEVIRSKREIFEWSARTRASGRKIAFTPTMGALHDGHLSLVKQGLAEADTVVASIFVNPTQFAAHEDFGSYPRQEARDFEMLESAGCAAVYCPRPIDMYPDGDSTRVIVKSLSHVLEGEFRPHFFEGVASVVSRLFLHVAPDVAIFGEKDYQQLMVIQRMTEDLGFPIRVLGAPTRRDPDGLAMSSRNAYLTAEERRQAVALPDAMKSAISAILTGKPIADAMSEAQRAVLAAGFSRVDYLAVRHATSLSEFDGPSIPDGAPARLLAAAWLGRTRLIDNMAVDA